METLFKSLLDIQMCFLKTHLLKVYRERKLDKFFNFFLI